MTNFPLRGKGRTKTARKIWMYKYIRDERNMSVCDYTIDFCISSKLNSKILRSLSLKKFSCYN